MRITVYNVPRQISEDQTATFHGVRKGNGSCWFLFSHNIQKPGFLRLATKFEYPHFCPKLRDLNKAHLFDWLFSDIAELQVKFSEMKSFKNLGQNSLQGGYSFEWLNSVFSWYTSLSTPVQGPLCFSWDWFNGAFMHMFNSKIIRIIEPMYFSCSDLCRPEYVLGPGTL